MTAYTIHFRNHTAWACHDIKAETPEKALALARKLKLNLCFEAYDITTDVNVIVVSDADGNELASWYDEDMTLGMAARDLLEACEMILDADGKLYAMNFEMIRAAIAKAKGGAA